MSSSHCSSKPRDNIFYCRNRLVEFALLLLHHPDVVHRPQCRRVLSVDVCSRPSTWLIPARPLSYTASASSYLPSLCCTSPMHTIDSSGAKSSVPRPRLLHAPTFAGRRQCGTDTRLDTNGSKTGNGGERLHGRYSFTFASRLDIATTTTSSA